MNKNLIQNVGIKDAKLARVTLQDEFLCNAEKRDLDYLLGQTKTGYAPQQILDPYRFLAHFYTTAGLKRPDGAEVYEDSWERSSDNNFRGHMFGHYMSSLALAFSGSKDEQIKNQLADKINICVTELAKCQQAFAEKYPDRAGYIAPFGDVRLDAIDGLTGGVGDPVAGTVFVPWYNLHKVLAGLLDIYKHTSPLSISQLALTVAKGFGDYFYQVRASKYTPVNKEKMLATEYGGMNDAFYELYRVTGDAKYRICAEMFDEVTLFDQLANMNNVLPGRHANTQVPKFIGALKRYTTLTQNKAYYDDLTPEAQKDLPKYLKAVQNFFDIVLENHSYITGGNSCDEHFHAPDTLASTINKDATHETCNVHNMLKIARELFKITGDKKYADYYENAFINAILSAQNPETGEMMYFQPMGSGYYKLFRHGLFWCCTGTGIENYVKLGDSIYFTNDARIYVNLYFSSQLQYEAQNLLLKQLSNLTDGYVATFTIDSLDSQAILANTELYLRVPHWSVGLPELKINGHVQQVNLVNGYMKIQGVKVADEIVLTFKKEVQVDQLKDNQHVMAFRYGPTVLSAGLGNHDLDATNPNGIMVLVPQRDPHSLDMVRITNGQSVEEWQENLAQNVIRDGDGFRLKGTNMDDTLVYRPHYKKYQERYALYLTFADPESEAIMLDTRQKEKLAELEKAGASAYLMNFDNHAYEAEYRLLQHKTATASWPWHEKSLRMGRDVDSWFSYDLPIVPGVANFINTTLFTEEAGRTWAIYMNDVLVDHEVVREKIIDDELFYVSTKEIPARFLRGDDMRKTEDEKPYVTVKFQATTGPVGGIFGITITQH